MAMCFALATSKELQFLPESRGLCELIALTLTPFLVLPAGLHCGDHFTAAKGK